MKIFNLESPLMQALGKMADLMWVNVLTILLCLPVVTAGAALTAMNYVTLKIVRDEECYITKDFFKSFKQNFKQGTAIWLILLVVSLILVGDFFIMKDADFQYSSLVQTFVFVAAFLVLMIAVFVFPVLAKFDNKVLTTLKNAWMISIMQFPKTVVMILLYAVMAVILVYIPSWMPLTFFFGLSGPAWVGALMYNKFFAKLEAQILGQNEPAEGEEAEGEDEKIFHDELDPALADKDSQN